MKTIIQEKELTGITDRQYGAEIAEYIARTINDYYGA